MFVHLFADVYIDVPDIIDISHMRSKGLQHGEELLPESGMYYDFGFPNTVSYWILFTETLKFSKCACVCVSVIIYPLKCPFCTLFT